MLRRLRPSPSMGVALLALFIALAGSAAAQFGPFNGDSIINKRSLSGNRLKDKTLTGKQINVAKLGKVPSAQNATNARNATNAAHATNATNARNATNGQPVAFAHVHKTGGLDIGSSKNVGSTALNTDTVTNGPSLYCIKGIPFTPRGGQATVDGADGGGTDAAQVTMGTLSGCPSGTQAMVYTFNSAGANPDGFFVVFYR